MTPSRRGHQLCEPWARRWATLEGQVRTAVIVIGHEALQRPAPLVGTGEDLEVQALAQHGPDPALTLAIRLRAVGAGALVGDAQPARQAAEDAAAIGGAVEFPMVVKPVR